ncbi:immunoglobulin lambda variable 4-69 [Tupaia chinensis]|uniref:immunoglobulin lambda variable 4-69 n=1 Tax=Tupaia chinensis TaxID=246437 RepID=UPI0002B38725|nr:immunoglobulin lambda variable 4-69 [Tupaia chinensis]XP_014445713.1 immunoglobulin lambda variable 4-69 [Tupaia chinensis]ELW61555.1 Immunoglobulin omega chain [Tupaia chinensis]ELW61556.1 Immunoglobulin omega chain [Tupaia chinensis]
MAKTPLSFLILLFHCTGSFSQPVQTQLPSTSASLGALAKLICTLSREHSTFSIEWFQQQPEKAPWYVMELKSDESHRKEDGIHDRFSGSSSGANHYLIISKLQPEDEADYICGISHSNRGPIPVKYSD